MIFRVLEPEDHQTVMKLAGDTSKSEANVREWLEDDEEDPGYHNFTEVEIALYVSIYTSSIAEKSDKDEDKEPQEKKILSEAGTLSMCSLNLLMDPLMWRCRLTMNIYGH